MDLRYDRTARLLHWLIAALLIGQFAFGWWLGEVPRNTPARGYFVNLHKSAGLLIGLLILLRLVWRFMHAAPALPDTVPRWQQRLAASSHFALYLCMVLMPLSGYLASNFSKYGVKFFNTVSLPPWGGDDKQLYALFNQTHKTTALVLATLVVVHVLAAFKHGLQRDGVIHRMWIRPF
jgi:cytochrome b561